VPGLLGVPQLGQQSLALALGPVDGEERLAAPGAGWNAPGRQAVEGAQRPFGQRHQGGHPAAPLPVGAVPHE
jgi:hypothetical protein